MFTLLAMFASLAFAQCTNPTCNSPPCAARVLGDVGCTTVSGTAQYTHGLGGGQVVKGETIASGAHIFGPFEAGFTSRQDRGITNWGCTDPSVVYDAEGGRDVGLVEREVAYKCSVEFPRIEGDVYYGVVGFCGGHTHDYHFHNAFACLYEDTGGHSAQVGEVASHFIYGEYENSATGELPLLDACGGHFGVTPDSNGEEVYHYHVQDQAPFTIGCHGPAADGGLVSVQECRDLYDTCDGDISLFDLGDEVVAYDRYCPCYDANGSNTGVDIVELPALAPPTPAPTTEEIHCATPVAGEGVDLSECTSTAAMSLCTAKCAEGFEGESVRYKCSKNGWWWWPDGEIQCAATETEPDWLNEYFTAYQSHKVVGSTHTTAAFGWRYYQSECGDACATTEEFLSLVAEVCAEDDACLGFNFFGGAADPNVIFKSTATATTTCNCDNTYFYGKK